MKARHATRARKSPDASPAPRRGAAPGAPPGGGDRFDEAFYRRYYFDPATRVASRADAELLGNAFCAQLAYLGVPVRRVLDAGCGLGHLRTPVRRFFPRARYVGLESSEWLCRRHRWVCAEVESYRPSEPFDLVICHDVLQYLDERSAARAIANLGRLSRAALFVSVLTLEDWDRYADQTRTDAQVHLRPADWYRRRLGRCFRPLGGGLLLRRGLRPLLWELERPWPAAAHRTAGPGKSAASRKSRPTLRVPRGGS